MENEYVERLHDWQEKFRVEGRKLLKQHDRYEIIDNRYVPVRFFNTDYTLDLADGILYEMNGEVCSLQPMSQMMIYSHLSYLHRDARLANRMESLSRIGSVKFLGRDIIEEHPPEIALIKKFDEDTQVIDTIVKEFNAKIEKLGDIGFSLEAFKDVRFQYIYWRGDDEFPSNLNVCVDENLLQYIHEEAAGLLASIGIELMCQKIGLEYPKWSWEI
jgi:hypothetical protein